MKKLLFLFVLLTSLSKAQNDSIAYFAYTDYNNNCVYEPGMGEEPLKHFGFDFIYKYGTGFYQINSKTTDDYGYVKFYVTGAMAPASNTLTVKSCGSPFPSQFSACYNPVDLTYNTTYSVGVYSPAGPSAFNYFSVYSSAIMNPGLNAPSGYNYFCIGRSSFMVNYISYNFTGNNSITSPMSLSFQGGSTNVQMFGGISMMGANNNCSGFSGGYSSFTNPELSIPGIYTVTLSVQGVNGPAFSNTLTLIVDSCSMRVGNIYNDCNTNCAKDITEYNCDEEVIYSTNGTFSVTTIPDYNGNYSIVAPYSNNQYSMTITPNADFALACSTPSFSTFYSNASYITNTSHVLNQTAVNNVNYSAYIQNPFAGSSVPGGAFKMNAFYHISHPDFCNTVNNAGVFYVKLDPSVQLVSLDPGTPAYTSIHNTASGDSIVWAISDLRQYAMNFGGHIFTMNLYMVPTATIGLPFYISSGLISNLTETTLIDNRSNGIWMIGGPFDPNYKEVSPKGTGAQGYIPTSTTELLYTIHFQNVGNAPAINVKIKDMLDSDLDKNTLKIIGSSAPVQVNIDGNGMSTFMFNNIMLADSTHDEPNSHGFVTYKINLKSNLPVGTQIDNTANIYFDYNSAIVTNTTLNTLQAATGIQNFNSGLFEVYPNPSNGVVKVNSSNMISKITVINVLGEIVKSITADSKQVTVDLTDLKSNVYFLQITDANNQTSIKKIVKE
jgi:hypothetical protein